MDISNKIETLEKLIGNVSRETLNNLLLFEAELYKWNQQINLISDNTKNDIWNRHILDSVQLNNYIYKYNNIIDIGSGGGFPAIILAILNKNRENFIINLIEKLQKKCVFLQNITAKLQLPAVINNVKIENYNNFADSLVITSRAFASIDQIFQLTEKFFKKDNTVAFLQKGENYEKEIEIAKKKWIFSMDIYNSKLHKDSVILKLSKVKRLKLRDTQ